MRADVYIVAQGAASSRTAAQKLISAGAVTVDGKRITKASEDIPDGEHVLSVGEIAELKYVSRGGLKLEAALDAFGIAVEGLTAADIGASTGGFTDCLLSRGARRVFCVDAGHGQLHPRIASDPRVRSVEGCNARTLTAAELVRMEDEIPDFDGRVDLCVMDVSFISQTCILPALSDIVREGGGLVSLIKPQFELGAGALGKGGVVRRAADREAAVRRVLASADACGFSAVGVITSPIEGGDGNVEYVGYFRRVSRS